MVSCCHCDRTLFLLLRTFLEIIALRKGPANVPKSWLLLLLSIVMLVAAAASGMVLIVGLEERNLSLALMTGLLAIAFYAGVLFVTGFSGRILQALTCIIGCGAILTFLSIAVFVLFRPFVGQGFAGVVAVLISFWSVPVEGHILARSIGQHWYVGIAIAVIATILQFVFQSLLAVPVTDAE